MICYQILINKILVSFFFFTFTEVSWYVICSGNTGWAAPRLKDAALSLDKLREGYFEVRIIM